MLEERGSPRGMPALLNPAPSHAPIRGAVRRPCLPTSNAGTRGGSRGPVQWGRPSGPGQAISLCQSGTLASCYTRGLRL